MLMGLQSNAQGNPAPDLFAVHWWNDHKDQGIEFNSFFSLTHKDHDCHDSYDHDKAMKNLKDQAVANWSTHKDYQSNEIIMHIKYANETYGVMNFDKTESKRLKAVKRYLRERQISNEYKFK